MKQKLEKKENQTFYGWYWKQTHGVISEAENIDFFSHKFLVLFENNEGKKYFS